MTSGIRRAAASGVMALVIGACGGGDTAVVSTTAVSGVTEPTTPASCQGVDYRARVALYASAQAGEIDYLPPPVLGGAVQAVPPGLFTGVLYAGCAVEVVDTYRFERMVWTNGIGVLALSYQEWPDDGPLVALPFGGESRQAGVVQVSAADVPGRERTRVIHLYDGSRVVSAVSFDLTTLSVEQLEEIAWAAYDTLPMAVPHPGPGQRTFSEMVAAIPSDTLSVSGIEDSSAVSPFTEALGMPVVTRQFIAGGAVVTAFDFGAPGAADRGERAISSDGYTIAHQPYDVFATPRYWRWDRVILQYMGDDAELLTRLVEVLGQPFAGPQLVIEE